MSSFTQKLNFSNKRRYDRAVKIDRRRDVNYYETLCLYCANNDIDLEQVSDTDFDSAGIVFEEHGKLARSIFGDVFYFWMD